MQMKDFFCKIAIVKKLFVENYMIPCLSKTFFGIECMGCGFQRALVLMFEGKFAAAFLMYPALYNLLFFAGVLLLHKWDKKRNYQMLLIISGSMAFAMMIGSYLYKVLH